MLYYAMLYTILYTMLYAMLYASGATSGTRYITGRSQQVKSERMIVSNFGLYMRAESPEAVNVRREEREGG